MKVLSFGEYLGEAVAVPVATRPSYCRIYRFHGYIIPYKFVLCIAKQALARSSLKNIRKKFAKPKGGIYICNQKVS
jgi:hypothetical protein